MTLEQGKRIFIWGTAVSAVVFLILSYDSLVRMPQRTHGENLDAGVVAGKWVWQKKNCNDCHTILGIGGYYAPDVTKVMDYRNNDWMTGFLKDPGKVWPAARRMPNLRLQDQEVADVISFLTWVKGIDTNNWPPQPMVTATSATSIAVKPGEAIFKSQGCTACHRIGGVGGSIGPDLDGVGARRDKTWIAAQIVDPKSHNPGSIMPGFSKLPRKSIDDLTDYLAGQK